MIIACKLSINKENNIDTFYAINLCYIILGRQYYISLWTTHVYDIDELNIKEYSCRL